VFGALLCDLRVGGMVLLALRSYLSDLGRLKWLAFRWRNVLFFQLILFVYLKESIFTSRYFLTNSLLYKRAF